MCHLACRDAREQGVEGGNREQRENYGENLLERNRSEMKAEGESENQYEKREQMEGVVVRRTGKDLVDQRYF